MNERPLDSDFSTTDELIITPALREHFAETAKWAKFLAIVGFVGIGLTVLMGLFMGLAMNTLQDQFGSGGASVLPTSVLMMLYFLGAALYFLPVLYLFRFAGRLQLALKTDDSDELQDAFANLKSLFKFIGILTIVMLGLYAIGIIFFMVIGAMGTAL